MSSACASQPILVLEGGLPRTGQDWGHAGGAWCGADNRIARPSSDDRQASPDEKDHSAHGVNRRTTQRTGRTKRYAEDKTWRWRCNSTWLIPPHGRDARTSAPSPAV